MDFAVVSVNFYGNTWFHRILEQWDALNKWQFCMRCDKAEDSDILFDRLTFNCGVIIMIDVVWNAHIDRLVSIRSKENLDIRALVD